MGTRAESGERARLVLEADRLDIGRSGDVERDRRGWIGVRPPELIVLPESLLFPDLVEREPADCGVLIAPLIWL